MAAPTKKRSRKSPSGSRTAILVILILIIGAVSGYFWVSLSGKNEQSRIKPEDTVTALPQQALPHPPDIQPAAPIEQGQYSTVRQTVGVERPASSKKLPGRLAVIVDDMGSSMTEARLLAEIKVPITFAIIPGLRADKDVAAYAAGQKIETMIHIPMQSKGWPSRRLESNGLLMSMPESEIQERVFRFVQQFPGAVGANNHMGSEFTEHDDKMIAALQPLKKNNMFFIDSVTSSKSVAFVEAHRLGIRSARRNVFLDNEQDRSYILNQLRQAVRMAQKSGSSIAICHPHPATIAALAEALPELAGQGVTLVPVSQLVK